MLKFLKTHGLLLALLLVTACLAFVNQQWVDGLYFNRANIEQGSWWQLWTGHLSHATRYHWLMNMAAVVALYYFFKPYFDRWHWLLSFLIIMPASSLLFFFFNPEFDIYTGFSGLVQAWLSFLLVRSFRESPLMNAFILAAQWGRIAYEHTPGYNIDYMQDLIGTSVAVDAHLYGAGLGVLCGLFCLMWDKKHNRFTVL